VLCVILFRHPKIHTNIILKSPINISQFVLTGVIAIVCILIIINYGSISFATFTMREGLNGGMYYYYRINRIVFALYEILVTVCALLTIYRLSFSVYKKDKNKLTKVFMHFAIFFAVLILCEIYLSTRFVGKG
jgi:uncharacterized membrane protein